MKTKQLTVAITGAGAPGTWGTLYSLRNNPDAQQVRIVGFDIKEETAGRYLVDSFATLPSPSNPDYLPRLLSACRREKVEVILPQTTAETAFLALNAGRIHEAGIALVAPPREAQAQANSKAQLLAKCEAAGIPVPNTLQCLTVDDVEAAGRKLGYPDHPFVIKPAISTGSRGFRIVSSRKPDLRTFLDEKPARELIDLETLLEILSGGELPLMLASEFLPGAEYSVDVFRSVSRCEVVPRLRTTVRTGISTVTELVDEPELVTQSVLIAEALGLTGVFGFQFKVSRTGQFRLLECNPRVQGTMVASLLSGFNIIWAGVCLARGVPVHEAAATCRSGKFLRFWSGLGVEHSRVTLA